MNTLLRLEDFSGHGYSNKQTVKVVKQKKLRQFEIGEQWSPASKSWVLSTSPSQLPSYVDFSTL